MPVDPLPNPNPAPAVDAAAAADIDAIAVSDITDTPLVKYVPQVSASYKAEAEMSTILALLSFQLCGGMARYLETKVDPNVCLRLRAQSTAKTKSVSDLRCCVPCLLQAILADPIIVQRIATTFPSMFFQGRHKSTVGKKHHGLIDHLNTHHIQPLMEFRAREREALAAAVAAGNKPRRIVQTTLARYRRPNAPPAEPNSQPLEDNRSPLDIFNDDLCFVLAACNLPLTILQNILFLNFLKKHTSYGNDIGMSREAARKKVISSGDSLKAIAEESVKSDSRGVVAQIDDLSINQSEKMTCGLFSNTWGNVLFHKLNALAGVVSHTAEVLQGYVTDIIQYSVDKAMPLLAVVTDNARVMMNARHAAVRLANVGRPIGKKLFSLGCLTHILNRCTTDLFKALGVEKDVKDFVKKLGAIRKKYRGHLRTKGIVIPPPISCRWESYYDLFRVALKMRDMLDGKTVDDMTDLFGFKDQSVFNFFKRNGIWITIQDFFDVFSALCVSLRGIQGAFCGIDTVNRVVLNLVNYIKTLPSTNISVKAATLIEHRFLDTIEGCNTDCRAVVVLGRLLDPSYPLSQEDLDSETYDRDSLVMCLRTLMQCPYNEINELLQFLIAFRQFRYSKAPASIDPLNLSYCLPPWASVPSPAPQVEPPTHTTESVASSFWGDTDSKILLRGINESVLKVGRNFAIKLFNTHVTTVPIERSFSRVSGAITKYNAHLNDDLLESRVSHKLYDYVWKVHFPCVANYDKFANDVRVLREHKEYKRRAKRIKLNNGDSEVSPMVQLVADVDVDADVANGVLDALGDEHVANDNGDADVPPAMVDDDEDAEPFASVIDTIFTGVSTQLSYGPNNKLVRRKVRIDVNQSVALNNGESDDDYAYDSADDVESSDDD